MPRPISVLILKGKYYGCRMMYHIDIIWTPLLNKTTPSKNSSFKLNCNFYAIFMCWSEVKNQFWKIKPRCSNNIDMVSSLFGFMYIVSREQIKMFCWKLLVQIYIQSFCVYFHFMIWFRFFSAEVGYLKSTVMLSFK